jgi:hypothetical protein
MLGPAKATRGPVSIQRMHQTAGGASSHQILNLYDRGIEGCLKRDGQQVREALLDLMASLNFEFEDAAVGFFRIYELMLQHVRTRRFDVPLHVLRRLRSAWTDQPRRLG